MNIGFAREEDINDIQGFLDRYWKQGYILAQDRSLFEWQFRSRHEDRVNFVIARNDAGEVVGTLGFIPSDHHDDPLENRSPFVWLTNWMVIRGRVPPGLGIMLRRYLERNLPQQGVGTIGLNRATLDLYRSFAFTTGRMDHHVLPNHGLQNYDLLPNPPPRSDMPVSEIQLHDITESWSGEISGEGDRYLDKSAPYYRRRYLQHPVYHYRCLQLEDEGRRLLMFARRQDVNNVACLRIVEARGDLSLLHYGAYTLQELMRREGLEYIDLISKHVMDKLPQGVWLDAEALDAPNYFEPYQPGFVPLLFAYKLKQAELSPHLFKGDCDQDAPRIIR